MIWKNKTFVKMFASYSVSVFGDWLDSMAIIILFSYTWQASPILLALVPLVYALPGILFGQAAGVLVDRWRKSRLMIWSDWIRAALTVGCFLAPGPYWILALIFLRSCANVFHLPAQQALTRKVVEPQLLLKATTFNGMVFQLSKVGGPMLGAALATALSPQIAILINAVSFAVSALILLPVVKIERGMSPDASSQNQSKQPSFREQWAEGWKTLAGNRILWASLLVGMLAMTAIQIVDFQISVAFREIDPTRPYLTGWAISAVGFGALLTVTAMNRMKQAPPAGWCMGGGIFLVGVMFASLGFYKIWMGIALLLGVGFLGGIGTGLTTVTMNYLLQAETPKDVVGRIYGIQTSIMNGIMLVAPLAGGFLVSAFGAAPTFTMVGIIVAAIGAIAMLFQRGIWGRTHNAANVETSLSQP